MGRISLEMHATVDDHVDVFADCDVLFHWRHAQIAPMVPILPLVEGARIAKHTTSPVIVLQHLIEILT